MNPARLLQHFHTISEAPDAVARLRRLILDLAVRGKLVEQEVEDEPASELLARVRTTKARLTKAGKMRPEKARPVLDTAMLPFPIPATWQWSQLSEIGVLSPRNAAEDTDLASFVPMTLISAEYGMPNGVDERPWGEIKRGYTQFAEGDIGLAKITPCFENGKSTVFRGLSSGIGAGTTELHIVRPIEVNADYVLVFLKCPHFIVTGIPKMTGTAGQKRVPADYFANSPFPLPPLPEQHRIVAKVEELMALCDQLQAARHAGEQQRDRLVGASLHRLNAHDTGDGHDATELAARRVENARFHLQYLPRLSTRHEHIKQLRQAILNLAVRGKLAYQDSMDGLAITFDKAVSTVEAPFEIPKSWTWARICALGKLKGGGTPSKAREDFWDGLIPWVSPKDMKIDYLADAKMRITEAAFKGSAVNLIATGSVLFVVRGMILAHSFPVAVTRVPLAINQDMKALEPKKPEMAEYLLRALKALKPEMLARVQHSSHGTCRLEGGDYQNFLVPIPPLAEQRRIVAKVDELMALCDQLEASVATTQSDRSRLLDALLHEVLGNAA